MPIQLRCQQWSREQETLNCFFLQLPEWITSGSCEHHQQTWSWVIEDFLCRSRYNVPDSCLSEGLEIDQEIERGWTLPPDWDRTQYFGLFCEYLRFSSNNNLTVIKLTYLLDNFEAAASGSQTSVDRTTFLWVFLDMENHLKREISGLSCCLVLDHLPTSRNSKVILKCALF